MLIQFSFNNYKSFKDNAVLDLSAAKITEYSERVVKIGNEKILPVAAIYGANASGKSNVYSAFAFMSNYVIQSFKYGDEEQEYDDIRPQPFLFDSTSNKHDSSFEVHFTIPWDKTEKIYNYGFSLGPEGVTEEWFNSKAKTSKEYRNIFYRDKNGIDFPGLSNRSKDNIEIALEKQVLIASLGSKLRIEKCKMIRDWFLLNEFTDFGDVAYNFFVSRLLPEGFVTDQKEREQVIKYLSSFDKQICGFEVNKIPSEDDKDDRYTIDSLHKMIDSNDLAKIPFGNESAGTLKMFTLYPDLKEVLSKGGVYFVDELNARLHPLLVRNIVLTFLNPEINTNHAQLIFTTHDTWLLSSRLMRRDEIWFTDKNDNGVTTLYSLSDFVDNEGDRIRKDENYEKNYLLGKYGAIPSLESLSFLMG